MSRINVLVQPEAPIDPAFLRTSSASTDQLWLVARKGLRGSVRSIITVFAVFAFSLKAPFSRLFSEKSCDFRLGDTEQRPDGGRGNAQGIGDRRLAEALIAKAKCACIAVW